GIADDTTLSLRTIRTILDKGDGLDRNSVARLEKVAPDKLAEARVRRAKKMRDNLAKRINSTRKHGTELMKHAKLGLRRRLGTNPISIRRRAVGAGKNIPTARR